jgi:hypothetical protein
LEQDAVDEYIWKDGKSVFEASMSQLRGLISKQSMQEHIGVQKWREKGTGVPANKIIWRSV